MIDYNGGRDNWFWFFLCEWKDKYVNCGYWIGCGFMGQFGFDDIIDGLSEIYG